ncbi:hypothetical protein QS306_15660 [Paraburkholderia bonniea]|uniref:hypothetical protein n=1 Tax=Paraburkholderia bonniea TaxID=2152891 RepID=UPI0012910F1B|nr:hypothetical protein [Paraburkholderia bonniea]WJF91525.1 hypothetical protein QS306_15660 [Paraburkholderia bonniea]WJF94844.1 hypothetical protein QS308_15665 [Paraburkholderia bonniea]
MSHIPPYVVVLFGVLVYLGIKRCYARLVRPAQLFVLPLVMLVLGALSLPQLFPAAGWPQAACLLLALALGVLGGWAHAARWPLEVDVVNGVVRVPGDPVVLALLLLTFAVEFFMHYQIDTQGPWANSAWLAPLSFAAWGLLGGMSAGRALNVLVRYCKTNAAFSES